MNPWDPLHNSCDKPQSIALAKSYYFQNYVDYDDQPLPDANTENSSNSNGNGGHRKKKARKSNSRSSSSSSSPPGNSAVELPLGVQEVSELCIVQTLVFTMYTLRT